MDNAPNSINRKTLRTSVIPVTKSPQINAADRNDPRQPKISRLRKTRRMAIHGMIGRMTAMRIYAQNPGILLTG